MIILLSGLLASLGDAHAWSKTGHRVTGAIAAQHLSDDTRQAIKMILGVETLAEASTWADFMRSSPDSFWRNEAGPYHYVTIPVGESYADIEPPQEGDAITALQQFAKTLKDPQSSILQKQLALRFSVHIIGDLHQPLHAGNGTDRGGNDFLVTFFDEVTNLHAVWDGKLIDDEQLSYRELTDWLSARLTPEIITDWSQPDPVVWVTESAAIRDTIYPQQRDLNWNYIYKHRHTMRTRLSQAGIRMAAYFNKLFSKR